MQALRPSDKYNGIGDDEEKRHPKRRPRVIRNRLSPPTSIEIRGVPIHFPFRPYPCQITYMTSVIQSLQQSENALLESPTGTGKTLCLLCACLAFQQSSSKQQVQSLLSQDVTKSSDLDSVSTSASTSAVSNKNRKSTIIYASRTHSQLSQVVRELRSTRYRPNHAVLGSREQLCVHPKVNPSNNANNASAKHSQPTTAYDINQNCSRLGKERKCSFRNRLEGFTAPSNDPSLQPKQQPIYDLEELITMGKEHQVCPFYYTRALVDPNVDIVFIPYNYLFDKDARETTLAQIHWENAIIIFDEAHNLESFASESSSFDLSNIHIAGCITEVTKTIQFIQNSGMAGGGSSSNNVANLKLDNLIKLKSIFLRLENYILNLGPQTAYNGEFMMEIFNKGCGINFANHEIFIDEVRKVNDFLMDLRGGSSSNSNASSGTGAPKLEHFIKCIKCVYGHGIESRCIAKAAFYRVHVSPKVSNVVPSGRTGVAQPGRIVSYWCFAPSLAMEELASLNVRSILVTSGTLSPLPSYSMELGLHFPHMLENPHIISSDQVHVRVIGKGVSGKLLNSSYERRQNNEYYLELGNTLVALAKVVPEGMLLFFPSYSVMESCIEAWGGPASSRSNYNNYQSGKEFFAKKRKVTTTVSFSFPFNPTHFATETKSHQSSPWKRLLATKSIVIEPKASTDLPDALSDFKRFLAMPKSPGCILMGVCRGKISEGIDFADEQSRAVVITGLPFPPSHDTKVKMKREYLDNKRVQGNKKASENGGFAVNKLKTNLSDTLSGNEWYTQQAHRAVNQAIGRVIRNRNDYGAVLLLDSRFDQPQNQQGLSKWLRPHIQKDEGFGSAIRSLADFYRSAVSFTEKKKAEEKKAVDAAKPILEYDDDVGTEENLPNKIAVIRRYKTDETLVNVSDHEAAAYVDPNDVVARLDVDEVIRSREVNSVRACDALLKVPNLTTHDDIFEAKMPPPSLSSTADKSKNLAAEFMEKIKQKVSLQDQSRIRKLIVSMKNAGESNNHNIFVDSAISIVTLLISCESLDECRQCFESSMLHMFYTLLPRQHRIQVEILSFEVVFKTSQLFQRLQAFCDEDKLNSCRIRMGQLLQKLWCRKSGTPLPCEIYLREANFILQYICNKKTFDAYVQLIPTCYYVMTQTWVNEISVTRNIERMKEKDRRNIGDESVDLMRFTSRDVKPMALVCSQSKNSSSVTTSTLIKQKITEPFVVPRLKGTSNPYSSKTATVPPILPALLDSHSKTSTAAASNTVKEFLESAENDVYLKPNATAFVKSIKTNAPKTLTCPICSETCREPFIAECGHVACLSCWLGWLMRSNTCMTCRVETKKDALARVVYERKAGTDTNPSLTQLCHDDDSDDGLEICA